MSPNHLVTQQVKMFFLRSEVRLRLRDRSPVASEAISRATGGQPNWQSNNGLSKSFGHGPNVYIPNHACFFWKNHGDFELQHTNLEVLKVQHKKSHFDNKWSFPSRKSLKLSMFEPKNGYCTQFGFGHPVIHLSVHISSWSHEKISNKKVAVLGFGHRLLDRGIKVQQIRLTKKKQMISTPKNWHGQAKNKGSGLLNSSETMCSSTGTFCILVCCWTYQSPNLIHPTKYFMSTISKKNQIQGCQKKSKLQFSSSNKITKRLITGIVVVIVVVAAVAVAVVVVVVVVVVFHITIIKDFGFAKLVVIHGLDSFFLRGPVQLYAQLPPRRFGNLGAPFLHRLSQSPNLPGTDERGDRGSWPAEASGIWWRLVPDQHSKERSGTWGSWDPITPGTQESFHCD